MKVALINVPRKYQVFEENLQTVSEEFGLYPPLNLAYIAALLEKHNHNAIIIDANALRLTKEQVLNKIRRFNPGLIGFNLHSIYDFQDTIKWIKLIKSKTKARIIVGGINLILYPREILSYNEIDFGFSGSISSNFIRFIEKLESKKNDFKDINGLYFRKNNKLLFNKTSALGENLDKLPFPARHLLPNEKYYQFISKKKNFTVMLASVGCPYACTFCCIPLMKYKARQPKKVVDEMEECKKKFNINEIDFFDAVFTLDKRWVLDFCSEIKKRNLKISWSCRSRIDNVDKITLKKMADAGCTRIYYGIETIDKTTQDRINKKINLNLIKKTIALTKKYKIKTLGFFMIGNPGETKETIFRNVDFAKKIGFDYIQFSRTIAKPGSKLYESLKKTIKQDFWADFVLGKAGAKRLPNPWCDLSEKEIEQYTQKAYLSFYLRPKYIIMSILNIKSTDEFFRYMKAAFKMIFIR
ncbi:radical SAM protein [Candidatus Woesearchaeota archaeon]|nr:radical SAM protein [Candidatus Woesearchaeota archaeon]